MFHPLVLLLSDGADFTATSVDVVIPASGNQACARIPIIDDSIALEPERDFQVTFSAPPVVTTSDPIVANVTVIDDDSKRLEISSCI